MTISIIIVGLLLACLLWYANRKRIYNSATDDFNFWAACPAILVGLVFIVGAFVQPYRVERINAGSVGLQVKLAGTERGVTDYKYATGWVIYNSWWTQIVEIPTTIAHIEYKEQPVTTKGGFPTVINPTFNYTIKPETAGDMYATFRKKPAELEEGWLKTAIVGASNDIANLWTIDSIFNNLGLFELTVKGECNKRLDRWFSIDQLRINIVPPDALKESIAQKTKAIQDVQVAENQKRVTIADGERRIAKERADSTVAMIKATTEISVIRMKQQQLTPMYIEWIKADKWDGHLPSTMLGNGTGVMLNLNK